MGYSGVILRLLSKCHHYKEGKFMILIGLGKWKEFPCGKTKKELVNGSIVVFALRIIVIKNIYISDQNHGLASWEKCKF